MAKVILSRMFGTLHGSVQAFDFVKCGTAEAPLGPDGCYLKVELFQMLHPWAGQIFLRAVGEDGFTGLWFRWTLTGFVRALDMERALLVP